MFISILLLNKLFYVQVSMIFTSSSVEWSVLSIVDAI